MRGPMRRLPARLFTVAVLSTLFVGLIGVTAAQAADPTITSFTPTSGPVGTTVTITGTNFNNPVVTDVEFDNRNAGSFTVVNDTTITATVPNNATDGPIQVTNADNTATSSTDFDVTPAPAPTITSFTPTVGPIGTSVVITGTNFTGATAVRFNQVSATYTVNSSTQITATVPTGATTGPISVTTPGGTATSATNFTVRTTHARSVTLNLSGHLTARGIVTAADGFASCENGVTVKIQKRRRGGGWRTIRTTTTDASGGYQVDLPDRPGSYRAVATRVATASDVCPRAKSAPRRHRH
jgi:IPT/TIG domain-containing protein